MGFLVFSRVFFSKFQSMDCSCWENLSRKASVFSPIMGRERRFQFSQPIHRSQQVMELMAAPEQKSREVRREALLCCPGPWAMGQPETTWGFLQDIYRFIDLGNIWRSTLKMVMIYIYTHIYVCNGIYRGLMMVNDG